MRVGGWRLAVGGDQDDGALRARFRDLAAEDRGTTPRFSLPQPPVRGRWPTTRVAFAAAGVLAVAGAVGYAWRAMRPGAPPYPIDLSAVTWNAPTDFLLETPGAALLRELPTLGTRYGASVADPDLTDDTLRRNRS